MSLIQVIIPNVGDIFLKSVNAPIMVVCSFGSLGERDNEGFTAHFASSGGEGKDVL
jgi:hypothetical protein